jgi:hypothetical protein
VTLRIVGAGLGRTGTSSLRVALEQLLGGDCYHMIRVMRRPEDVTIWRELIDGGSEPDWTKMFADFEATLDWPAAAYWERIAAAFPDAFVLLSTRASADEWYSSFERTILPVLLDEKKFAGERFDMARAVTFKTFTDRVSDAEVAKRAYEAHNVRVRATVPPERLIEWQPGDGWKPLCDALGVDVPNTAFPHMNAADEFREVLGIDRDQAATRPSRWRQFRNVVHRARLRMMLRTSWGRRSVFTRYFHNNHWGDPESVSGPGSNLDATRNIRDQLPGLLGDHGIRVLLDLPCGDAYWMRQIDVDLDGYIGADVVPDLVDKLAVDARPHERFVCLDAISDPLPPADAVLCRDFFIHLSNAHIHAVLDNIRKSGARYLLASNYSDCDNKKDIMTGFFHLVNLEIAPFNLGAPVASISESYPKHPDKVLALWDLTPNR